MLRRTGKAVLLVTLLLTQAYYAQSQACTTLGQTPSTAFPVCGNTSFVQTNVPICRTNDLYVPGCQGGAGYANKNPFWYKFTCFVAGTLGFVINPADAGDDYDWQLYDITGLNPDEVYTNGNIIVTGNWAGNPGPTGTSANGANYIQCASSPTGNEPRFARMPQLIAGHEYILLVSHFTDSQSGYTLTFGGGTAVITDPATPHLQKASPDCNGQVLKLKLNKKMRCNSLTAAGNEFSISPALATVTSVTPINCSAGFDFDSVEVTLSNPLPAGDYNLIINNGSDNNTLLDNCGHAIAQGESVPFRHVVPQPIFADSIGTIGCAPDELKLYFPKKLQCNSIAPDGSDFTITGPAAVTVASASADCSGSNSNIVTIRLSQPIYTGGTYQLRLVAGIDGTTVIDECGIEAPVQQLPFEAADTVSAAFDYLSRLGCRKDPLLFSHKGAHDVKAGDWSFNSTRVNTRQHQVIWPASSVNEVSLTVSNGVCSDTHTATIILDNEVIAGFDMPADMCPEDALTVTNTSTGLIDGWQWTFGTIAGSTQKDAPPVLFPSINREVIYPVKLVATNTALGCSDSVQKNIKVLNNCFIAVPTAFTPNGDGLNDFLYPNNAIKADNLDFRVFNRWGQLVFQSSDWTKKWDGKINGVEQTTGVYVWSLSYTHRDTGQKVFQKGTTTLIR